ncbi:BspA family leucine-rich repeat surface protein [Lactobacillus sp. DCY120]|uniref:BspA family leucine-rich repeat surface protein n=1 Tax=Bombilactobacillus apium TaxID=2675299 RepID=A0A850QYI4_9LACO|nr:BspA family leucine-rich repeat surface protein [Bombilactobacillus apium]NVY95779.1 BspA family leucine-rich repeat surface protein [Bombilactobacillus apium]
MTNVSTNFLFANLANLREIINLENLNTINTTSIAGMFKNCVSLTNLDLKKFNTTKVVNMNAMFYRCLSLINLDLANFNTVHLSNIPYHLFYKYYNLSHLVLGANTYLNPESNRPNLCRAIALPTVPRPGTKIPGTNRHISSSHWVAISGYQRGQKYSSDELVNLNSHNQTNTYEWDSLPRFTRTIQTHTATRTINIYQPNGEMHTETQTATIFHPMIINNDGTRTYGSWSNANWQKYTLPQIVGYEPSQKEVSVQVISASTSDQTVDIFYNQRSQKVTIQYLDQQNKIVKTQEISGYAGDPLVYRLPAGYQVNEATTNPTTIVANKDNQQTIPAQVQHQSYTRQERKTLTRNIVVHFPNGLQRSYSSNRNFSAQYSD